MPQSTIKVLLIIATSIYFLSGCGGGGYSGGSDRSGPGSATVSWMPPTSNTDGSYLSDLAGYRIYYGTSPSDYTDSLEINNPGLSSYVVEGLDETTWYFVMTAVNTSGVESSYSEEVALSVSTN